MEHDIRVREAEAALPAERSRTLPVVGLTLAVALAAAAFFSGLHLGAESRLEASIGSLFAADSARETVDLSRFFEVWDELEERFVSASSTEPVSEEERLEGAIRGLVESYGDPYTTYLPPEDAALFEEDIAGEFQGVGMEVGMRANILTIIAPLPGTPAERAGIRAGDAIVRINGESTERMSVDEAVKRIRGEKGTTVSFTLYREGEEEFIEVDVVRDTIDIPTLETEVRDGVFVIRLFNFSAPAEAKFELALREYSRSGESRLLLDLRGNPGGYLESSVAIASYFLPTGKAVVREHFGEGKREGVHRSFGRTLGRYTPVRMGVLVDGGSASASEILAGALSEHGVATLIGERTFGKGSVQELVPLSADASLKVTVARWLTPEGVSISESGLTPDVEVADDPETPEDEQLEAALEFLNR